jgi:nucleoside-diphosphate-sugar epimerase
MKFTVLGASGFIGTNMCSFLREKDVDFIIPGREFVFNREIDLGNIIYAIGLTADFRIYPMDTVKAHVCKLIEVLDNCRYDSFTYLSSTRVYSHSSGDTNETANLVVNPNEQGDLYNISKLMGESVCLSFPRKEVRIVRLSNVVGEYKDAENFLASILNEIKSTGQLVLGSSLSSEKDYIIVEDVVRLIYDISLNGKYRLYNLASGTNITNQEILNIIRNIRNFELITSQNSEELKFQPINNSRILEEFNFVASSVLDRISFLSGRILS